MNTNHDPAAYIAQLHTERAGHVARIAEIDGILAMADGVTSDTDTDSPAYQITEQTSSYGTPTFAVTRTDGTTDFALPSPTTRRDHAELYLRFLANAPAGYRIETGYHPARSIRSGQRWWRVTGSAADGASLKHAVDERDVESLDVLGDLLIRFATQHADGVDARAKAAAAKTEADRLAKAAQDAAAEQARLDAERGPMATEKQIDFIMNLLHARKRSGEGGGFFMGPENPEDPETLKAIRKMTKAEASLYITSLKGDY